MELSLLLMLFAFVATIQSTFGENESLTSTDLPEEDSSNEGRIVFPGETEDAMMVLRQRKWKELQDKARSMSVPDLYNNGYKQPGITFSSSTEEHNYFINIYKYTSEAKCFQYKNEILRQRHLKENAGEGHGVIGGIDTTIEQHPYVGALGFQLNDDKLDFLCGCTLISHHFAVTAGHCSSKASEHRYIPPKVIRLGTTNIKAAGQDYKILRIIKHPNYKSPSKYYDIALVQVQERIEFSEFVQPACLWRSEDVSSLTHISVLGWGTKDTVYDKRSEILQVAEIDIIDTSTCKNLLKSRLRQSNKIQDHQICAGNLTGGLDSCQGDSGGPLGGFSNYTNFVIGIISFGVKCARKNTPSIYIRVSTFVPWIERIVWRNLEQ